MSEVLQCSSCGGTNQLPEGKTSMFCAFCGNAIEKIIDKNSPKQEYVSRIKVKPVITEPEKIAVPHDKVRYGNESSRRADGGHEVFSSILHKWTYFPDSYEEYGGGELIITGKEIKSLSEIIDWFTDSELESVKYLDLSNNDISDLSDLVKFKNAQHINLKNNNIKELNYLGEFKFLQLLNLNNNNISTVNGIFNNTSDVGTGEMQSFDEKLYGTIQIKMENNNISNFSEKALINLKDLLVLNSGSLMLRLTGNPIIKLENIKVFNKLKRTVTAKELSKSNHSWFITMVKYMNEYLKDRHSNDSFTRERATKFGKNVFIEWFKKFELESISENKIFNIIQIETSPNSKKNEAISMFYPSVEEVKEAFRLRTGSHTDEILGGNKAKKQTYHKPDLPTGMGGLKIFAAIFFMLFGLAAWYFSGNEKTFGFICFTASISYLVYSYNKYNWWA